MFWIGSAANNSTIAEIEFAWTAQDHTTLFSYIACLRELCSHVICFPLSSRRALSIPTLRWDMSLRRKLEGRMRTCPPLESATLVQRGRKWAEQTVN